MSELVSRSRQSNIRLFVSYSSVDIALVNRLLTYLNPEAKALGISVWSDRDLRAGSVWDAQIVTRIAEAEIFLLCMSPAYLGSEYMYYQELPAIMARGGSLDAVIVPVILQASPWWGVVGDYQAVPVRNGRIVPITEWHPAEAGHREATQQIVNAIRAHLGLSVIRDARPEPTIKHREPRSRPTMPSGPHRLSPDDIDRAVKAVMSHRLATSDP